MDKIYTRLTLSLWNNLKETGHRGQLSDLCLNLNVSNVGTL